MPVLVNTGELSPDRPRGGPAMGIGSSAIARAKGDFPDLRRSDEGRANNSYCEVKPRKHGRCVSAWPV